MSRSLLVCAGLALAGCATSHDHIEVAGIRLNPWLTAMVGPRHVAKARPLLGP